VREGVLDYEEAVLDIVGLIPAGKVLTYGDIAEILEKGGPRQVGAVMSRGGAGVPWWRVLRADGRPPQGLEAAAVGHYREESTELRAIAGRNRWADGSAQLRVDLSRCRWNPGPAEQYALQRIRAALERGVPADVSGLSETDDGVEP
jgi:alkylated DNA nucleotide flippase Atl1